MGINSSAVHPNKRMVDLSCQIMQRRVMPRRVQRVGGGSGVVLWQALSSAMIAWVLPEVLLFLVWEYSFSFIPQGTSLSPF
jgi:hypothetical protein